MAVKMFDVTHWLAQCFIFTTAETESDSWEEVPKMGTVSMFLILWYLIMQVFGKWTEYSSFP